MKAMIIQLGKKLTLLLTTLLISTTVLAHTSTTSVNLADLPVLVPKAPKLNAKAYVLEDFQTGKIIAEHNMNQRRAPASLTKMMTLYLVSQAIKTGRIHLNDRVRISKKAWQMGGSKMFVRVGQHVRVRDLIRGVIVDSGNDACVALAQYVAGSEDAFANLMNQQARALGMRHTHFTDSTGLPHPDHYTTPRDLAVLARALIMNFPQDYKWYKEKWFTFNNIKQPNRNRLLWRDRSVDGIKTGHTKEAGYCLVSSAKRGNMRLISVVMGAPTDAARATESQKLLTYGFRFYETPKLYNAHNSLTQQRVWMGQSKKANFGIQQPLYITIPRGEYSNLKAKLTLKQPLKAPIVKGDIYGKVTVHLKGRLLASVPLIALNNDPKGGVWAQFKDYVGLSVQHFFGHKDTSTTS